MNRINVLVYPSGAENALEVHQALKSIMNVQLFGASSRDDHGSYVFAKHCADAPSIGERDFIPRFNAMLEEMEIHVVIPTHDDVSLFLSEHRGEFSVKIATPGAEQTRICRSKKATYAMCAGLPFVPRTYAIKDIANQDFPLFVKPDSGQGGKGAFIAQSFTDLEQLKEPEAYVVCEFLPGMELTVDCFTDRHGKLRFAGPRSRDRVFGGISTRSTTVPITREIQKIVESINERLVPRGLWYLQLRKDTSGNYKLLEVSIRAAGTMNLYRVLGVNFPLLTVYDLLDMDVDLVVNRCELQVDRAFINRYRSKLQFDTVYIDYDDTITRTVQGKVDPVAMLFLYHMRNRGKELVLITKHEGDLYEDFHNYRIDPGLFSAIHHLPMEARKSDYIEKGNAIFVDNSFAERKDVMNRHGIPVFDVDGMALLIDWRE